MGRCVRNQLYCKRFPLELLNDFDHLSLIKCTTDNLVSFTFFVYVGFFLDGNATFSKSSSVNCSLYHFLKDKPYLEIQTLSPIHNLGFLYSCRGLLYRTDRKSEFLTFFWYQHFQALFSEYQGCEELRKFVNVLVSMIFHITVK